MIKKSYEINKSLNEDFFLLYGENIGLIEELINKNFKNQFKESTFTYNEKEIFKDISYFYDNLLTNSFFESSKLIIIKEISDKSLEIVETLIEKKIKDLKIIFVGKILDKKSKIRKFFEKEKNLVCIPCYQDNFKTLSNIVENFFKELKRSISADLRNLIIEKSQGDRKKLINDLNKIDLFLINKKQFKIEDIKKLISTSENQNLSELADYCLAKNLKKTTSLLNDYLISNEENILLIKIFISKIKRLKKLKKETNSQKNLDILISNYKPPIFWKDKDLVKQQINSWTYKEINELLKTINNLELKTKKNYGISNLLTNNFIMEKAKLTNS